MDSLKLRLENNLSLVPSRNAFFPSFYRDILLSSYEQLDRLCKTSQARPDLAALTHALSLNIPFDESTDTEDSFEIEDPGSPESSAVTGLFRQLLRLQQLSISGSSRIAALTIAPASIYFGFCSTLRNLELESTFFHWQDPLRAIFVSSLRSYYKLKRLTLQITRTAASVVSPEPHDPGLVKHVQPLPSSLEGFGLCGPLFTSRYAEGLVKAIPSLAQTVLASDGESVEGLSRILRCIQQPDLLDYLSVLMSGVHVLSADTLGYLRLFTRLNMIALDINISPQHLFPVLAELPLQQITLCSSTPAPTEQLVTLVSGNEKIKTLKQLKLNTVDAVRGKPVPREFTREELAKLNLEDLGWELAEWTDEFSREGLKEFLALAKKEEIEVTGDAVESLKIEEEWEEEMEYYRSVVESL